MNKFPLKGSIIFAFLAAFLVVFFFVWATFRNMQIVYQESKIINASSQVQQLVDEIHVHIEAEETAGNNFILSPNDNFLKTYNQAAFSLLADTANLSKILLYDTSAGSEIAELKYLVIKKISRLQPVLSLFKSTGNKASASIIKMGTDNEKVKRIRILLALLENKNRNNIIQSGAFQEKIAQSTTRQFLGLAFIFLALLLLFLFIINDGLARHQQTTVKLSYQASLIDSISDAIISTDDKFIINGWNKFAKEMYGYSNEEAIGTAIGQLINLALTKEEYESQLNKLKLKGYNKNEYTAIKKNGETIFILASVTVLKDKAGDITGYLAVHKDITERKSLEKELNKLNTELTQQVKEKTNEATNILDRITDGFLALNCDFVFTFVNKKAGEILGYQPEKMIGKNICIGFPDTSSSTFNKACLTSFETQQYQFLENYYAPVNIWIENYIYPSPDGLSVFFKDITAKKNAEMALRESEQHYKNLIKHMHAGIVVHNPDTSIALCNPEAVSLLGLTQEQMQGKKAIDPAWSFLTADGKKMELDQYPVMQVIKNSSPLKNLIGGIYNPQDKSINWVLINAFPEFDTAMKLRRVLVTFVDITDRKKSEEQLKQREEALNRAQRIAQIGSWEFNLQTYQLNWSNEMYRIFELEGVPIDKLYEEYQKKLLPEGRAKLEELINKSIATGEGYTFDHHIICKDGSIKHILGIGETIKNEEEIIIGLKGTGQDVTVIKKAEEQLQKSYEDIRQLATHLQNIREEERTNMAREIHDELGQQLTGINMYISWLNKKIQPQEEEIKNKFTSTLELIEDTVNSVREISTKLRPSMLDDLGLVAAMEWQSNEFEKRSGIITEFINQTGNCTIDVSISTGLFRIFQESLTNVARHAAATKVIASLIHKNKFLQLTITDDGKGFVLNEIGGRKTLGLFGMKQRTMVMGGTYEIKTSPGSGTIVSITVPLQQGK